MRTVILPPLLLTLALLAPAAHSQPAQPAATPAPAIKMLATPALWKIHSGSVTLYLFGNLSFVKAGVQWYNGPVKQALAASDALYVAAVPPDSADRQAMNSLLQEFGLDREHPLSTRISKEDVKLLDAVAKSIGAPGESAFEPMKPWLACAMATLKTVPEAGYENGTGSEDILVKEARAAKKPVLGFDTMADHMREASNIPMPEQVQMLHRELTTDAHTAAYFDAETAAWTNGDRVYEDKIDDPEGRTQYPALYHDIFERPRDRYLAAIEALLKSDKPSTTFVALGFDDFCGPGNIADQLTKHGFTLERVQ